MSDIIRISTSARVELGTAASRRLRRAGQVPAVLYAHGDPAVALAISEADARLVQYHASLLELADEQGAVSGAVVKEVQVNAMTGRILHIDFHGVSADEVIESVVELVGAGEPVGVRAGGEYEQVLYELTVKSKPGDVPERITVDVSGIELDQALHVRDIVAPAGVEIVSDPELVAFHVRTVKAEEEAPAEEAAAEEAAPAEEKK